MFLIYNRCSALVVSAAIVALTVTGAPVRAEESFTPQSEAASGPEPIIPGLTCAADPEKPEAGERVIRRVAQGATGNSPCQKTPGMLDAPLAATPGASGFRARIGKN